MTAPVHITKRALAVQQGRNMFDEPGEVLACGRDWDDGQNFAFYADDFMVGDRCGPGQTKSVTCPACLVLLDAELERGAA